MAWYREPSVAFALTAGTASVFVLLSQSTLYGEFASYVFGVASAIVGALFAFIGSFVARKMWPRHTVFISYAHEDAPFVRRLMNELQNLNIRRLEGRDALSVGDDLKDKISDLINESDYFIYVASEHSRGSTWVPKELDYAISRKKKILPAVLDENSIPDVISDLYYADFSHDFDNALKQIQESLAR